MFSVKGICLDELKLIFIYLIDFNDNVDLRSLSFLDSFMFTSVCLQDKNVNINYPGLRELCLQVLQVCWNSPFLSWYENLFSYEGMCTKTYSKNEAIDNLEMAYSSFIKLCVLHRHSYNWTLASQSLLVLAYKCFWLLLIRVYCLLNYNNIKQLEKLLKRQRVAFFSITQLGFLKGLLTCTPK